MKVLCRLAYMERYIFDWMDAVLPPHLGDDPHHVARGATGPERNASLYHSHTHTHAHHTVPSRRCCAWRLALHWDASPLLLSPLRPNSTCIISKYISSRESTGTAHPAPHPPNTTDVRICDLEDFILFYFLFHSTRITSYESALTRGVLDNSPRALRSILNPLSPLSQRGGVVFFWV